MLVGSGFAGVEAASVLAELGVCDANECIWVSSSEHMVFTPLVPALVSGRYKRSDIEWSIRSYAKDSGFVFIADTVNSIDYNKAYLDSGEEVEFDYAIIAAGASPAYYGVTGAAEYAIPLYGVESAEAVRKEIEEGSNTIAIVGAGFVGVEVAGELLWYARSKEIDLEVMLIDMLKEPLALLGNAKASKLVRDHLEESGAKLILGRKVAKIEKNTIILDNGEAIKADTILWCAGFQGPRINLPREALTKGQFIQVDQYLRVNGMKKTVYAAGDSTSITHNNCMPLKMAREAIRMGAIAALNVALTIKGQENEKYIPKITTCTPQAGISLDPYNGVMIIGKNIAYHSTLPQHYHELLRKKYKTKLTSKNH